MNDPLVKVGRSQVKEEAKERKEKGRNAVCPSHGAVGVGRVLEQVRGSLVGSRVHLQ